MGYFFNALLAAATVTQETPIDGQTGVWLTSGTTVLASAMKMSGAVVGSGQTQTVYHRGSADSTAVSGGSMYILSGGVANSLTAHGSGVRVYVSRGGTASGVEIYSSARVTVAGSGASASGVSVRGPDGFFIVLGNSAGAENITMSAGAYVYVYQSAVLSGITQFAGNLYISSAGRAAGVTVNGGGVNVYANGSAADFVVSGGRLLIHAGGLASGVVVNSGGSFSVNSGGTALAVTSNAGATVNVESGGYIEYATP